MFYIPRKLYFEVYNCDEHLKNDCDCVLYFAANTPSGSSIAGRCTFRARDHHCVWVGQCIAERNRRFFFLFLVLLSGLSFWFSLKMLALSAAAAGGCGEGLPGQVLPYCNTHDNAPQPLGQTNSKLIFLTTGEEGANAERCMRLWKGLDWGFQSYHFGCVYPPCRGEPRLRKSSQGCVVGLSCVLDGFTRERCTPSVMRVYLLMVRFPMFFQWLSLKLHTTNSVPHL